LSWSELENEFEMDMQEEEFEEGQHFKVDVVNIDGYTVPVDFEYIGNKKGNLTTLRHKEKFFSSDQSGVFAKVKAEKSGNIEKTIPTETLVFTEMQISDDGSTVKAKANIPAIRSPKLNDQGEIVITKTKVPASFSLEIEKDILKLDLIFPEKVPTGLKAFGAAITVNVYDTKFTINPQKATEFSAWLKNLKNSNQELEYVSYETLEDDDEREFEFELEGEDDDEREFEFELEGEDDDEREFEFELEGEDEEEEDEEKVENFAERFYELYSADYELPSERDEVLNQTLDEMEYEFMTKRAGRKRRKKGKKRGGFFKGLLKVAGKIAKPLIKTAANAVVPGAGGLIAGAAMDVFGKKKKELSTPVMVKRRRIAARKMAKATAGAFKQIADTVAEKDIKSKEELRRVAKRAVIKGLKKNSITPPRSSFKNDNVRRIKISPGQRIIIES